jgi:hypothetical protein
MADRATVVTIIMALAADTPPTNTRVGSRVDWPARVMHST